jgi:hypothetical protein
LSPMAVNRLLVLLDLQPYVQSDTGFSHRLAWWPVTSVSDSKLSVGIS